MRAFHRDGTLDGASREAEKVHVEISGISEMRWTGCGNTGQGGRQILYSRAESRHERGVGFLLGKDASKALTRCLVQLISFVQTQVKSSG